MSALKTNQELIDITKYKPGTEDFTDEYANLSDDDKARWENLYNYQQRRSNALTINGKRYSNENDYNSIVTAINNNRKNFIIKSFNQAWEVPTATRLVDKRNKVIHTMQGGSRDTDGDNVVSSKEARAHYRNLKKGYRKIYNYNRTAKAPINISTFRESTKPMSEYKGPSALTGEELNATTFNKKNGGQLKYYKPIK